MTEAVGTTGTEPTQFVVEPGKQEITITRVFDAPRELVFLAFTNPEHIPHWWGPKYLTTTVDAMDVRPGGVWRFLQRDAEGNGYAFHGVYHDVVSPRRLVYTFEFEGTPGRVLLETVTFEDLRGKTKMTDKVVYQSVGDRDGMVAEGMEYGSRESMDRIAELLAKL
jgi:uncharacterized protein YndB with AHSA1/START domain